MHRLLLISIVLAPLAALADLPTLVKVDTEKQPLKLSVPEGWEVHLYPPKHRDLSSIGGTGPRCPGVDVSITLQLDQDMKSPAALLADQYKGVKPKKLHGWECVMREVNTEVMCAGTLKGLTGIVSLYFATTSAESFKKFGDPAELVSQVAATMSWKGKVADLTEWRREASDAAKASCK
ncbi:MAG: hypothetical protein IPJ65_15435 [Archangiaceae bacterium]|nr:hypothetical protein [Archangiaceae bacterium]